MPSPPRVVYATRNSAKPVPVHVPPKYLPIVVVPGIMGSRLTDPRTGKLVWNPLGEPLGEGPDVFTVDPDRLQQITAALVPDETHRYELKSKHDAVKHIKHFYNLIPKFYGKLALHLADMKFEALTKRHLTPKVYCCGYDWRQDNARSAARLAGVVEEALRETGARKCIIVAHSMGGLVSRYYCRVLGGESRVHQLILLASPTLGSPAAYAQLRQGLYGVYIKDIVHAAQTHDDDALTDEVIESELQLLAGLATTASQGVAAGLPSIFGDLLLAMSLGGGRFLTREESRYFARQLPAIYQLMPNAAFCHRNPFWTVFDPLATGHRPTGFMLQLPTVLDLASSLGGSPSATLLAGAERVTAQFRDDLERAAARGESVEVSGRALRNSMTLGEWGEGVAAGPMGESVKLLLEMVDHCGRAFVDGRSSRALYSDIYTGLMDVVALRPMSAANLALSFAFDSALTVDDRPREPLTPIGPIKDFFGVVGRAVGDAIAGPKKALDKQEMRNVIQAELDAHPPRVYMHPRTANIYGSGVPGDGGAVLIPRRLVSRDDSNLVKILYLPRPVPLGLPHAMGDGTVPTASANPDADLLSNPFVGAPVCIPNAAHSDLPVHADTLTAIDRAIGEQIADFPRD